MKIGELDAERRDLLVGMGFPLDKSIINLNGYPALHIARGKLQYAHRLVAAHYKGAVLTRAVFVHHVDEDRWNFRIANLHVCSHGEHNGLHRRIGPANHFFGKKHSPRSRELIRAARLAREGIGSC